MKRVTFPLRQLEFNHSFSFLSSSLDKLVKLKMRIMLNGMTGRHILNTIWHSPKNCSQPNSKMSKHFKDDCKPDILTDKGICPYYYVHDDNKLNEAELPKKRIFIVS